MLTGYDGEFMVARSGRVESESRVNGIKDSSELVPVTRMLTCVARMG